MKNLIFLLLITLVSCQDPGLYKVSEENDSIEVYKYYYNDNNGWIYITKLKNKPIETINWEEQHYNHATKSYHTEHKANAIINQ